MHSTGIDKWSASQAFLTLHTKKACCCRRKKWLRMSSQQKGGLLATQNKDKKTTSWNCNAVLDHTRILKNSHRPVEPTLGNIAKSIEAIKFCWLFTRGVYQFIFQIGQIPRYQNKLIFAFFATEVLEFQFITREIKRVTDWKKSWPFPDLTTSKQNLPERPARRSAVGKLDILPS